MVRETTQYYKMMSETVPEALRRIWNQEIEDAEQSRLKDPAVMDILGAQDVDTNPQSEGIHVQPLVSGSGPGSTERWLHLALAIEEKQ